MEKSEINVEALGGMSENEFFRFCQDNDHLRIEREATGKIIIMSPTGSKSGHRNFKLNVQLGLWNQQYQKGYLFDSSAGFTLPNGATRSPDVSFVLKEKWESLTEEQQEGFAPICPDFVIELRSKNDQLKDLQIKMEEYISNGATFGWLIDPYEQKVYIYDKAAAQTYEVFELFDQPLRGKYFMDDFSLVPDKVL
jgi:Uma2 family endonuclease